jgi:hypothetical protein
MDAKRIIRKNGGQGGGGEAQGVVDQKIYPWDLPMYHTLGHALKHHYHFPTYVHMYICRPTLDPIMYIHANKGFGLSI